MKAIENGTKLVAIADFCLVAGRDVAAGDVFVVGKDITPARAQQILTHKYAEPVVYAEGEDNPAAGAADKAAKTKAGNAQG